MNKNLILHFAIFIVSFAPLFAKSIDLSADIIVWWRCLLAFIFLSIFLLITKKYRMPIKYLKWIIISGIFLGFHWWTFFLSIQYSSVAIGVLTLFTFPLITAVLEPFYTKTKFSFRQVIGAFGVIVGIYFLIPEFSLQNTTTQGVFLGLSSAFVYTLRNIITKKHLTKISAMVALNYQLFFSVLILSIPIFFSTTKFILPTAKDFVFLILLSSLFTIVAHGLLVYCFKFFSAATIGIVASLQVFYSTVFAFFILSEVPNFSFYIGSAIIMMIAIYELFPHKKF